MNEQNKTKSNNMKKNNWVKWLMQCYCFINGFKVKELKSKSEFKVAFDLKNKVNQALSGLKPLPANDEFVYPKGAAYALGVFKKKQLIGTIQLSDLTQVEPLTAKLFPKVTYQPESTYEVKSFVVDTSFQKNIGAAFNILVFYCIAFSNRTNRDKWLVITSNTFYKKIKKRSGLETELLGDQYEHIEDNTFQSRYSKNYVENGQAENLCCYYILIPKGVIKELTLKFLKNAMVKTVKKLNVPTFTFPSIIQVK